MLVGEQQSAFVPDRHIADNVLLMQELMRGYHRGDGAARCALKVDIQKAYDSVEWSFVEQVLVAMNFPAQMIKWIMVCVTTPYYSISLNGYLEGYFKGEKGLRQGDPISPYIFILIMEAFSNVLEEYTSQQGFVYHPKCEHLGITHLIFADDLFLLCGANCESLNLIRDALKEFGDISGPRPNLQKSHMFVTGVNEEFKADLVQCIGMESRELPVKYLGVPLISTRLKVRDCEEIKKKILNRVQCWTAGALSYAGRIQLIISVLHSVQAYWSSIFILPKKVLKDIDDILRNFLWTGTNLRKSGAKVAWEEVCCPKNEGGLGIKSAVTWNKALMVRHLWDLARKKDSLWVKWCHSYMLRGRSMWGVDVQGDVSWTWRKLMKLREVVWMYMKYKIGDGKDSFMWIDNWHPCGPLLKRFGTRILYDANSCLDAKVEDCIQNGNWRLPRVLSRDLITVQNNFPRYSPNALIRDKVEWYAAANKQYSCRTAWEVLRCQHQKVEWADLIWNKEAIPRCSMIWWLACKNRLSTKDRLYSWGIITDNRCVLCADNEESRDHLYFGCSYTREVWNDALFKCNLQYICNNWADEVQEATRRFRGASMQAKMGRLAFTVVVYCIWKERNQRIFKGEGSTVYQVIK